MLDLRLSVVVQITSGYLNSSSVIGPRQVCAARDSYVNCWRQGYTLDRKGSTHDTQPTVSMYLPEANVMEDVSSLSQLLTCVCPPKMKTGVVGWTARMASRMVAHSESTMLTDMCPTNTLSRFTFSTASKLWGTMSTYNISGSSWMASRNHGSLAISEGRWTVVFLAFLSTA